MNFRTLIMLAIAALVIVVAVKMNRNSVADPEELPVQTQTAPTDEVVEGSGIMTEEEAQDLIYDDMDGTVDVPENPDAETGATIGDKPMTEGEAGRMEPAAVDESPADALEDGPAEEVSEEPVTPPSEEKPATE